MTTNTFEFLQDWYVSNCNGDWEHEYGIKIDTLDNPGWMVIIDLEETKCEDKDFEEVKQQSGQNNWIHCYKENGKFKGFGSPKNLENIIKIFMEWQKLN